ncbi:hypothetical protein IF2G_01836 [Cordyceps javanica]|nr:hypothetical protein IF2G_01836 [Cordyceps javanica]
MGGQAKKKGKKKFSSSVRVALLLHWPYFWFAVLLSNLAQVYPTSVVAMAWSIIISICSPYMTDGAPTKPPICASKPRVYSRLLTKCCIASLLCQYIIIQHKHTPSGHLRSPSPIFASRHVDCFLHLHNHHHTHHQQLCLPSFGFDGPETMTRWDQQG